MTRTLDVAGTVITVPDPDEIAGLSGRFRAMGDALADAQEELSAQASVRSWSQWTGPSATAFGQTIGQLPGQLGAAQESYHEAAAALSDYADQVRPVVATLTSLATQADDAVANLTATQTARDQAAPLTTSMTTVPHPDLTGLDLRVTLARAAVEQVRSQVRVQQSELTTLATRCVTRIHQALPPQGKHTGFLGELGHLGRGTLGALGDLTVHPFVDVYDDAGKLRHDFSWVNIGKALGDVADVLTIVALIPGADVFAVPLLVGVSAAAVTADLIAKAKHEHGASYAEAGAAALTGLLGVAGPIAKAAGKADVGLFTGAYDAHDLPALKALADGKDARVSGAALLKSGIRQTFNGADVRDSLVKAVDRVRAGRTEAGGTIPMPSPGQLRTAATAVSDRLTAKATELVHLGADSELTHSPAATVYQHLGFLTDRASELVSVEGNQLKDSSQSQTSGSAL